MTTEIIPGKLPFRTRVKVCGLTNREDLQCVVRAGADAVGFIYYRESPRHLDLFSAGWIAETPPLVTRTAVLVDPDTAFLERLAALRLFHAVQLHGHEPLPIAQAARDLGFEVIKAFRPQAQSDFAAASATEPDLLLADTPDGSRLGGSGKTGDWSLAAEHVLNHPTPPLLLSGGLNPGNVGNAIAAVHPYGVDVSSGLESSPGRKAHRLVEDFFIAVRAADDSVRMR